MVIREYFRKRLFHLYKSGLLRFQSKARFNTINCLSNMNCVKRNRQPFMYEFQTFLTVKKLKQPLIFCSTLGEHFVQQC